MAANKPRLPGLVNGSDLLLYRHIFKRNPLPCRGFTRCIPRVNDNYLFSGVVGSSRVLGAAIFSGFKHLHVFQ